MLLAMQNIYCPLLDISYHKLSHPLIESDIGLRHSISFELSDLRDNSKSF